jgi:ATP-binding cassette subfamily B protein
MSATTTTGQKPPKQRAGKTPAAPRKMDATERAFHEEKKVENVFDRVLLAKLWPFVRPHAGYAVASLLVLLLSSAANLLRPKLMGDVVGYAEKGDAAALLRTGWLLAVFVILSQVFGFIQQYLMQVAGARAMADLRGTVFRFLQRLSLRTFDRTPVGRLVTRATSDVDAVGELFASGVLNALGDILLLVGIVIAMLKMNAKLAGVTFAALPVVGLIVSFVRKRSREAFRDIRIKTARLNAFLNEQVSGIAVVQAYAREKAMADEFDGINDGYRQANKSSVLYEAILDAAIELVSTICIASILWFAGLRRFAGPGEGAISFALLVTFTQYVKQFFEPVSMLAARYTLLQSALSGAERIFELLGTADVEEDGVALATDVVSQEKLVPGSEAVVLDHVDFGYKEGVPVLRDVSLRLKAGEKIALVGATGAGKTTIASLVLRLYDTQAGRIEVLGRSVTDWRRRDLRAQFAVVPQDVFLFAGTLLSNVAVGDAKPDSVRVRTALEQVGAGALLAARGLDGVVDERGANFSAGERQLIAFARALYHDRPLLLLDEATANIDSDTEAKLQAAVDKVLEGRTAIVIAHRLSTIKKLDRILVFHKGRIVEEGTHDELLAKGGVFAKLHALQFKGD